MKALIENITRAIVDYPEQVNVREITAQQTQILELRVAKEDLGKVIGKHGRSVNAIRTLLSCSAAKNKKRVIIEVIE